MDRDEGLAIAEPRDRPIEILADRLAEQRCGAQSVRVGRSHCTSVPLRHGHIAAVTRGRLTAAWAAATRAIGTRNGEQLT